MPAAEKTYPVGARFTAAELDRIDEWLTSQRMPPSRSQFIVTAVIEFLDREETETKRSKKNAK